MKYKLVCFDVDGTLVDNVVFSWELFHEHFNTDKQKRAKARDDFFAGKISYEEWALHDIELWKEKGANKVGLTEAVKKLKLMRGAMETIDELKKHGVKLAIISGTINIIPETLIPNIKGLFDDIYYNRIDFDDEGNISDIKITEFDIEGKEKALRKICDRENIGMKDCVFIGDHMNDLKIISEAGLGIAFDPKDDKLKEVADIVIEKKDLRECLKYILD